MNKQPVAPCMRAMASPRVHNGDTAMTRWRAEPADSRGVE